MEISNLMPSTTVMVGVRVLMGCRSLERVPSFIEVLENTACECVWELMLHWACVWLERSFPVEL